MDGGGNPSHIPHTPASNSVYSATSQQQKQQQQQQQQDGGYRYIPQNVPVTPQLSQQYQQRPQLNSTHAPQHSPSRLQTNLPIPHSDESHRLYAQHNMNPQLAMFHSAIQKQSMHVYPQVIQSRVQPSGIPRHITTGTHPYDSNPIIVGNRMGHGIQSTESNTVLDPNRLSNNKGSLTQQQVFLPTQLKPSGIEFRPSSISNNPTPFNHSVNQRPSNETQQFNSVSASSQGSVMVSLPGTGLPGNPMSVASPRGYNPNARVTTFPVDNTNRLIRPPILTPLRPQGVTQHSAQQVPIPLPSHPTDMSTVYSLQSAGHTGRVPTIDSSTRLTSNLPQNPCRPGFIPPTPWPTERQQIGLGAAIRIEGAFEDREFAYTECLLRGLADSEKVEDMTQKLTKVLAGLTGSRPLVGVWKTECWRAVIDPEVLAASAGRLAQTSSGFNGELWLRRYSEPSALRNFHSVRMFSPEHLVVPPHFPVNARRVKEAAVAPQFVKLLPAMGFRRSATNDVFVSAFLFHHNARSAEGHLLILLQKHYKDESLTVDLFPGKYVVEVIGRVEDDVLIEPLSRRILDFCVHVQPFVQFNKF